MHAPRLEDLSRVYAAPTLVQVDARINSGAEAKIDWRYASLGAYCELFSRR